MNDIDESSADRIAVLKKILDEYKSKPDASGFAIRASGPITDISRKFKKSLVLLSTIGIIMIKTGLIPEKIAALGIDFTKVSQSMILFFIYCSIIYLFIGFILYIMSDCLIWKHSLEASEWDIYPLTRTIFKKKSFWSTSLVWIRIVFEVIIPILLGVYSLKLLWEPSRNAWATFF